MTHKIVTLKKGFAYTRTEVPFTRSLGQIQEMLLKYGCERIAVMSDNSAPEGPMLYTMAFQKGGMSFIIEFPVTYTLTESEQTKKLNMNISGRIIHDRIKALLIDVEIGYLDFAQAMMAYIAIPGPDNRPVSLMEYTQTHQDQLRAGRIEFRMLPEGGER